LIRKYFLIFPLKALLGTLFTRTQQTPRAVKKKTENFSDEEAEMLTLLTVA
jgi:hypothetical protein